MSCNVNAHRSPGAASTVLWCGLCILCVLSIALPWSGAVLGDAGKEDAGKEDAGIERESLTDRRQRLENLSAQEKEELQQKSERFYKLSEDEQDRLREMHAELNADPNADRLRGVMHRYTEWLKKLKAGERANLLSLSPDERVEKIREIRQEQEADQFRRLVRRPPPREDLRTIYDWLDEIVQERKEQLIAELSPERRERYEDETDDVAKRRILMFQLRNGDGETPFVEQEDLDRLVGRMSENGKEILAEVRTTEAPGVIIREWVWAAISTKMLSEISDEELQRFYLEDLPSDQRVRLENLPKEELQERLRQMYVYNQRFRGDQGGWRPPWFNGGVWRGRGGGRGRGGLGERPPGGRPGERPPGERPPGERPPRSEDFNGGPRGFPRGGPQQQRRPEDEPNSTQPNSTQPNSTQPNDDAPADEASADASSAE